MVQDPRIRAGIFAGESGGDYDALFGFSNRPGRAWSHIKPSQMTVGQVLELQSARGPGSYGQWTKDQLGRSGQRARIATPVGAYQVVGTTLKHAVNALGLDPNIPFNQETQDRIGQWILEQQGTGAWEGYRGPGDPSTLQARASSSGRPSAGYGGPHAGGYPGGGNMNSQWDQIIAAHANQQPEGPTDPLKRMLMAFAANAPRMHRGQGMDFSQHQGPGRTREQQSKTMQWLITKGRKDLAAAVAAGAIDPKTAISEAMKTPETPEATKGIEVDGRIINPVTGEVIYGGHGGEGLDKDRLNAANTLRDDIRGEMENAMLVKDGAGVIQTLYSSPGAVSDYALAVAFAKIVDPGSVAREGEVAAVQRSGAAFPQYLQSLENAITGAGAMNPAMRKEIAQLATKLANERLEGAGAKLNNWKSTVDEMGIPWNWVWSGGEMAPMQVPAGATPTPATPTPATPTPATPTPTPTPAPGDPFNPDAVTGGI